MAEPDQIASIRELNPATGLPTRGSSYEYDARGHLIRQLFSSGEILERQSDTVGNLYRSADRSDRVYGRHYRRAVDVVFAIAHGPGS